MLASFPETIMSTSQVGRPDDGMDFTGFFNTEYCVPLKPKKEWRPVFHQEKEKLIAAMNRELQKDPGSDLELFPAHSGQHGRGHERGKGAACDENLRR